MLKQEELVGRQQSNFRAIIRANLSKLEIRIRFLHLRVIRDSCHVRHFNGNLTKHLKRHPPIIQLLFQQLPCLVPLLSTCDPARFLDYSTNHLKIMNSTRENHQDHHHHTHHTNHLDNYYLNLHYLLPLPLLLPFLSPLQTPYPQHCY